MSSSLSQKVQELSGLLAEVSKIVLSEVELINGIRQTQFTNHQMKMSAASMIASVENIMKYVMREYETIKPSLAKQGFDVKTLSFKFEEAEHAFVQGKEKIMQFIETK